MNNYSEKSRYFTFFFVVFQVWFALQYNCCIHICSAGVIINDKHFVVNVKYEVWSCFT